MKEYSPVISLTRNSRGIYCLDTTIGCSSGMENNPGGCYGDCYSANAAKRYGYDFGKTVLRYFENRQHERETILRISRIKMPFVRVGCSGDPSEDWQHTVKILKSICRANKQIVIITKHWTNLTNEHLWFFKGENICVNTSISALDKPGLLSNSLEQYHRLKPFCRSVLRIVSCEFNLENETGHRLHKLQAELFKNEDVLDTVFRPNKNNPLITDGIVIAKQGVFMGKKCLMSKYNRKTYTGKCSTCHEMCGVSMENKNHVYEGKRGIYEQLSLI